MHHARFNPNQMPWWCLNTMKPMLLYKPPAKFSNIDILYLDYHAFHSFLFFMNNYWKEVRKFHDTECKLLVDFNPRLCASGRKPACARHHLRCNTSS